MSLCLSLIFLINFVTFNIIVYSDVLRNDFFISGVYIKCCNCYDLNLHNSLCNYVRDCCCISFHFLMRFA